MITRREAIRTTSMGVVGLGALSLPEWALPALAQGEVVVPFTDIPESFTTERGPESRLLDVREIDGLLTPKDKFFTTQHYGHPVIDGASFRLTVTGLVDQEKELSLDDLRGLGEAELVAGFECSGNSPRAMQGLASNGRWQGVPLKNVLAAAGLKPNAREVVFFGADRGMEEVEFRGRKFDVEQQYGRSLSVAKATSQEPFLAYGLNGEPLTRHQGFPLRLVVPGWYGAPNVKWLANIHVQEDPYLGKFQARWYRTLRGEMIAGEMKWTETAITRMRVKSVIARVTKTGSSHKILGFTLGDGTPLRSVEVKVDDAAWQPAQVESAPSPYSWRLFTWEWKGATPGEHVIVARATDEDGNVQPTAEELETKKTFLEDNSQFPRKVMIG
jgi:DMSO/TMAO reductase YedYZ molybdopterin-dependent catalytic subunit